MLANVCLLCLLLSSQWEAAVGFQVTSISSRQVVASAVSTSSTRSNALFMSTESDMEGKRGMKGYYRRPSRAIEKGGGFFVPGLEGEKIRVVSAAVLVLMIASNRAGVQDATMAQVTSEVIGVVMAVILFVQGIAEAFPQIGASTSASSNAAPISSFLSVIQSAPKSPKVSAVETAARSIIQTCGDVSYVLVVSNIDKSVVFEIGPLSGKAATKETSTVLTGFSARNTMKNEEGIDTLSMFQPSKQFLARISNSKDLLLPEKSQSCACIVDGTNQWTWLIASGSELVDFEKSQDWITALTSAPF